MQRKALSQFVDAMELVALRPPQVVHLREAPLSHVYFPISGLISLVMPSNGKFVETGIVGAEGFFGLPLLFGVDHCPMTAISQLSGHAMRIQADVFRARFRRDAGLASALDRYGYAFTVMLAQGSVCNSAHSIEQRCARWLLAAHDRVGEGELPLTQAYLAQILGVRRPSVSEVAEKLQRRRLIKYGQGRITILDRGGLEGLACLCYSIIRSEFKRVRLM
ncbi:MAG: Crp/Fnr family transcriptional regulator [Acidobacteriia bacterium]|nr:Crp/Fnr family transcriptional regulator [Terriglobia bacterium]